MHYFKAKIETEAREDLKHYYFADSMFYSGQGKYLNLRLSELLNPQPPVDEQEFANEIAEMLKNGGLSFEKGEEAL